MTWSTGSQILGRKFDLIKGSKLRLLGLREDLAKLGKSFRGLRVVQ